MVDELKDELFRIKHESQDECCLDVEEIRKEVDKEFVQNVRDEYFERHVNLKLKEIEEKEKYEINNEKEVKNEDRDDYDEQSEVESEDFFM